MLMFVIVSAVAHGCLTTERLSCEDGRSYKCQDSVAHW